jgi:hypothetical protein
MRRVLVAFVVLLFVAAPAAQAARPSVTFQRKTVTRLAATGKSIRALPRGRAIQFDVAYIVRNTPARLRAKAQVFVKVSRGAAVLRLRTTKATTSTGKWRWVLKGAAVRIPASFPAGTYTVRVWVDVTRGRTRLSRAAHAWHATVT